MCMLKYAKIYFCRCIVSNLSRNLIKHENLLLLCCFSFQPASTCNCLRSKRMPLVYLNTYYEKKEWEGCIVGYCQTFARLPQPCPFPITSTNERGSTWGWKWCESRRPTIAFSLKILFANDKCLSLSPWFIQFHPLVHDIFMLRVFYFSSISQIHHPSFFPIVIRICK